jgi:hypothetical protein
VADRLREQSTGCRRGGSLLYAHLLEQAALDLEAGGPVRDVLSERTEEPPGRALALRFMGALHRLVLVGRAPGLAAFYPSVGGVADAADPWPAFRSAVADHRHEIRRLLDRPCQTNDVGRSAAMLPGFLQVARAWGLPLRLLEVGASAGLNLRWDHFRYEGAGAAWGDPASPVRLADVFEPPAPPLDGVASVVERRGCDPALLDPVSDKARMTLRSFVWADQVDRLRALDGALEIAGRVPAVVDRAGAAAWAKARLLEPLPGVATVVHHTVVLQYLDSGERRDFEAAVREAGGRSTEEAPLAWLRMEPRDWRRSRSHEVWLTTWPGGEERRLALAGPHGRPVRWLLT